MPNIFAVCAPSLDNLQFRDDNFWEKREIVTLISGYFIPNNSAERNITKSSYWRLPFPTSEKILSTDFEAKVTGRGKNPVRIMF